VSITIIRIADRLGTVPSRANPNKPPRGLRLLARLYEFARRIRSRRMLSTLDDSALRDIGVTRSEAEQEAAKPFWRT
jgi:uncharacterized protein YjiS (DUF1127 family)